MSNVQTIQHVYASLQRGDVPSILATFAPAVEFRLAEHHPYQPSGRAWVGEVEITEEFFAKAGAEWREWSVAAEEIIDAGDAVIVECRYHGLYLPTGKRMDVQACHVWRFTDGKIASFHQYIDTAALHDIMRRAIAHEETSAADCATG